MKPIKEFYARYERWWPLAFFVLGFAYDIWSMGPIDSLSGILKQAFYLFIISSVLGLELLAFVGRFSPTGFLAKIWKYEEEVIHFFLGSLLSECTLFFFKSSSLISSFAFLGLLFAVILINEFKRFQGSSGVAVRTALLAVCVFAFFGYVVPLLLGSVGVLPFLLSLAITGAALVPLVMWLRKRLPEPEHDKMIKKQLIHPYAFTLSILLVLYLAKLIPPVPVSLEFIGVYHDVKKEQGKYHLGVDPRGTSFFQQGEKVFYARPGDKPYGFARIFSPSRFNDQVQLHWLFKDKKRGWVTADVIRMGITGGREQGFRGFSFKANYQPGDWQIRVETTDSREIGRVYFSIENDPSTEPRELVYEVQ